MVRLKDHERPDGSIDWDAYRKAEIAAGERCYECMGITLYFGDTPGRRKCGACERLDRPAELRHHSRIRCPYCQHVHDVYEGTFDVWNDGDHALTCGHCEQDFIIRTDVSYNFVSPALGSKEPE